MKVESESVRFQLLVASKHFQNKYQTCYLFQDWFYYCLVYDPQQKALLADKGEIGIGSNYQPVIPQKLEDSM